MFAVFVLRDRSKHRTTRHIETSAIVYPINHRYTLNLAQRNQIKLCTGLKHRTVTSSVGTFVKYYKSTTEIKPPVELKYRTALQKLLENVTHFDMNATLEVCFNNVNV